MTQPPQRSWENRRAAGRASPEDSPITYYGLPVIKKPHWKWLIVWYFFLGGISASSYVIATIASWVGGSDGKRIAQAGRYISLVALLPSPILLILDLGRPERFHHMLRVLKFRSPMSLGTWGLTAFGGFCGLSAVHQANQDGLLSRAAFIPRLLRIVPQSLAQAVGSVFAFFVGGYTGVLLAATAVPIWAKNKFLLGPLFLTSAMSSGIAAISLALSLRRDNNVAQHHLERLETATLCSEVALLLAVWRNSGSVIGRPLREGHLSRVLRWGVFGAGIGGPLAVRAVSLLGDRVPSRLRFAVSAVLTLIGGFCLRYVFVVAGRASADDPKATFIYTGRDSS